MSRENCRGDNGNLMRIWTSSDACWGLYYTTLYNKNGRPVYNEDGFKIVSSDVTTLIDNYINMGYSLTEPGLTGYNIFQDVLLRICNRFPGTCEAKLIDYCSKQTTDISTNSGLINFCGCYTDQQEYDGNVSKQCQPLCNRVSNVKLPNGSGGVLTCNDNICVIDQVSIEASRTETGRSSTGNVSFTQVCRCPEGQCKCIIGSVNLYGITGETEFKQVCGEDSLCYTITDNPNDPPVLIKCPEVLQPDTTGSTYSPYITWFIIIVLICVVFIIFII